MLIDLAESGKSSEDRQEETDPDQPVFSLVTGTYRHAKRYGGGMLLLQPSPTPFSPSSSCHTSGNPPAVPQNAEDPSGAVVLRNQDTALAVLSDSAAGTLPYYTSL